ncbi:hypothetical protein ES702_07431 [subsurface metagenome]
MATYKYYGLFGVNLKKPSGIFRLVYNDKDRSLYHPEGLDKDFKWEFNPMLTRYINGYSDAAEEITEQQANAYLEKVRKINLN